MPDIKLSDETKRLIEVYNDFGGTQKSFGDLFGLTQTTIHRMLTGKASVTQKVTRVVCYRLGYNPAWFIAGEGNKKGKDGSVKLVTDINKLRVEYEIAINKILLLEARMGGYEKELENIRLRDNTGTRKP